MNRRDLLRVLSAASTSLLAGRFLRAQGAELTLQPLSDGLQVLVGAGGNITILNTKEGLLAVDAGLPNTADAVIAKVKGVADAPLRSLINTHWHNDHTGGNVAFGKSGAVITAHVNTLKRVSAKQHMVFMNRDVEPLSPEGLPTKTFTGKQKMAFGGETLSIEHHPPAHTDGDTTIHFEKANILSAGDLLFNGMYPFIDYSSGGSIEGMIHNAALLSKMADTQTKIVPGHGPLATRVDMVAFHDMLAQVNESISGMINQGKSADELLASAPTSRYDSKFGNGFMKPDMFVKMLYQGKTELSAKKAA
jgi:cyclase